MTVSELIDKLKALPQDMLVVVEYDNMISILESDEQYTGYVREINSERRGLCICLNWPFKEGEDIAMGGAERGGCPLSD